MGKSKPSVGTRPGKKHLHTVKELLKDFPDDRWECSVRKMRLCIARGGYDAAHMALDQFLSESIPDAVTGESSVWMLCGHLPFKVLGALEGAGYANVRSVVNASDEDLRKIVNINTVTIAKIRETIETVGLKRAGRE